MYARDDGDRFDLQIGELCRNITRRKIVEIAKQHGWTVEKAGREQLKACRYGYNSVPIPGHADGSIIRKGTAHKVLSSLFAPLSDKQKRKDSEFQLRSQLEENQAIKHQLSNAEQKIDTLKSDVEAGFDLAAETENKNAVLKQENHQLNCWIRSLKDKIAILIRDRAQQELEMLEIAKEVEQQEMRIEVTAEMLAKFSSKIGLKSQRELERIIQYLKRGN
jgi:chromosome segregation ATPase